MNESHVALGGLVASRSDAHEVLQPAEEVLDGVASSIEFRIDRDLDAAVPPRRDGSRGSAALQRRSDDRSEVRRVVQIASGAAAGTIEVLAVDYDLCGHST